MKTKFLFGMFVSGVMLTACTADDLETAPVAQEVNPSAPVFNVSVEDKDALTRGTYLTNGHKLSWTKDDLLSLFHGATAVTSLAGTQNAVYFSDSEEQDGSAESSNSKINFVTAAMVQPGYAVMVYPADVTFKNKTATGNVLANDPVIYVSANQNASTKDSTAYISEVLNLSVGGKAANTGEAGYRKPYDIVLKRAVGTFHMPMVTKNPPAVSGVEDIEITSVQLISDGESFATKGLVKGEATAAYTSTAHPYWRGKSYVEASTDGAVRSVKSIDLNEKKDEVVFTLLPLTGNQLTNCKIIVNTTYGVITISDDDLVGNERLWVNTTMVDDVTKKPLNITAGLKKITDALFANNASNGSMINSWYGKWQSVGLNVDLSKAKQDGMHITTSKELNTAIKVFDVVSNLENGEKAITLYLDGGEDKRFTVEDTETWTLLKEHMADAKHDAQGKVIKGIDFVACNSDDEGHKCEIVRLINEKTDATPEVPSLSFADPESGTSAVTVELEGSWTYDGEKDGVDAANYELKTFAGVKTLEIVEGATLTATKKIVASGDVEIQNYGEIVVSGTVDAMMDITNWNKITIGVDDVLGVTDGKSLTNKAAQATGDHGVGVTGWDEGAVIDNHGWLAVKGNDENSAICNYGIINSYEGARTLITKNMRTGSDVAQPYKSSKNAIGTINIFVAEKSADNNVVVMEKADDGFKGFIVLKLDVDDPGADEIGDVANFVEIGGECANLTATKIPEQVKFIKITSSKEVKFNGEFNIDGLYLKPEKQGATVKANIPEGATVTVAKEFYLKGLLSVAGTLTKGTAVFNGYHGGDVKDENDYIYRAGGKIQ